MDYQTIIVEIGEDFVGSITLNRPENRNTFNATLVSELLRAFNSLESNSQVRVIILKGAGKGFCAGIDLKDFFDKTPMAYREWIEHMEKPLVTMGRMNKPVIAQVHGVAAANGAGLVAAADLAVAAEDARLGLTAINVGLNCIGPVIPVSRSIGRKKSLELLLFGDLISAPEAFEMGLINKVAPSSDLENETRQWAGRLAQKSPVAVQNAKRSFYAAADLDYYQAFNLMNESFAQLCSSEDAKEGVSAFIEKRKPNWKER